MLHPIYYSYQFYDLPAYRVVLAATQCVRDTNDGATAFRQRQTQKTRIIIIIHFHFAERLLKNTKW